MGIDGLLNFVKSASEEVHVSSFAGCTLAVDAFSWLHRGAVACAMELALGQETDRYLNYTMRMISFMRQLDINLLFVLDGGDLPMKIRANQRRREQREEALAEGMRLLEFDRHHAEQAFKRAINISSQMSRRLVAALKQANVQFVVAPYEADPQLCFLVEQGICAAAITEDSDLLAFRCPRVLYKLSAETGFARLHQYENLRGATDAKGVRLFDGEWPEEWQAWRDGLFTDMCIISGCDYLCNLPGVGLKTAHAALRTHRNAERAISSLHRKMLFGNNARQQRASTSDRSTTSFATDAGLKEAQLLQISSTHVELFYQCQQIFEHAMVWNPNIMAIVPLRPFPVGATLHDKEHLGPAIDRALANCLCAGGDLDVRSLQHIEENDGRRALATEGGTQLHGSPVQQLFQTTTVLTRGAPTSNSNNGEPRDALNEFESALPELELLRVSLGCNICATAAASAQAQSQAALVLDVTADASCGGVRLPDRLAEGLFDSGGGLPEPHTLTPPHNAGSVVRYSDTASDRHTIGQMHMDGPAQQNRSNDGASQGHESLEPEDQCSKRRRPSRAALLIHEAPMLAPNLLGRFRSGS